MDEFIKELLFFVASYGGLLIVIFFGLNWISKGWLVTYLKVKASRGRKTLIMCHGVADTYFRAGLFKENSRFWFKDRNKKGVTLTQVKSEDIRHIMGVSMLEYDVSTGNIVSKGDFKAGANPESADDLITRIIQAPKPDSDFQKWVLLMLGGVLLLSAAAVYFGFVNNDAITGLKLAGMIV